MNKAGYIILIIYIATMLYGSIIIQNLVSENQYLKVRSTDYEQAFIACLGGKKI